MLLLYFARCELIDSYKFSGIVGFRLRQKTILAEANEAGHQCEHFETEEVEACTSNPSCTGENCLIPSFNQ